MTTPRFCDDCAYSRESVVFGHKCLHPLVRARSGGEYLAGDWLPDCHEERSRWVPWAPCGRNGKLWEGKEQGQ